MWHQLGQCGLGRERIGASRSERHRNSSSVWRRLHHIMLNLKCVATFTSIVGKKPWCSGMTLSRTPFSCRNQYHGSVQSDSLRLLAAPCQTVLIDMLV